MATDATETLKHDMCLEVTELKGPERRQQGKFQPFRRLFGKKKKKREAKGGLDKAELKASFSTGQVHNGVVSDDEEPQRDLRELNPIGSRALSHDSIFIPEEPEDRRDRSMSQENVSDKVRSLQKQIAQGIKFGQRPPSLRKSEGDEGSSDEEEVPPSPLKVLAQVEAEPANTEPKVQAAQQAKAHSTPVKSPRSKRVLSPAGTIESINLDAVPQSGPRLDNTAAKHKLSVKPKNQRISRKHRRFTQDLQEVSIPDAVQEDLVAAGTSSYEQRRASADSLETLRKQRLDEEERCKARRKMELEEQRLRQEEEERKRRAAEELRLRELEEERCRKQQEDKERKLREEVERGRREEEEKKQREEEERRQREKEEEMRREEKEERRKREEERVREEEERRKREEEEQVRRQLELDAAKKRKQREDEEQKKREEAEKLRLKELEEKKKEEAEERIQKEEEKEEEEEEQRRQQVHTSDPQEAKRRAEELRWREMEERQRPFSFKVSSGEKQILFQKVNLTPVTPAASHQSGAVAEQRESASSLEGPDSPNLPASPYVPHTAILVTGAQLCGTAVNLDQIKDTACKSLLGLGEDRKVQETPPTKSKTSPDRKSGKTKSLNEASLSSAQSGAAVLAEWASIRSKIFKGVEEGKYDEYPDPSKNQPHPSGEDPPTFSHTNLRKTVSASAKFSITPAKKKFGDSNRNSEVFGVDDKEAGDEAPRSNSPTTASPASTGRPQSRSGKTVRIVDRGSEECMFAKDLPSFLVPSHGARPEGLELKSRAQSESEVSESCGKSEDQGQDGEEKPSPFGIKLRRTNYSLRFHSEQSTEKRKKRYSAGDSFDGVPSPLTPIEPDCDSASSVFSDKSTPTSPQKEGAVGKYSHASASPTVRRAKAGKPSSPVAHGEGEQVLSKPSAHRRPTTSPKPVGAVPTPPPSPLPKVAFGPHVDVAIHRTTTAESSSQHHEMSRSEEPSAAGHLHQSGQAQAEEELKEKRSFFPSINIPWREKVDRKTELIRREKPSLQSRHSLDSSRVQEKEAGPLWITLALQKQKGFREQQQSREERRSQREAKLAEKQARDRESVAQLSPTDSKGSGGSSSPLSKPQTPEEPKRPDSLLGRFERREHLKKANTLPSSVTVEIADSTPSPPSVKEVSKRFPSSDSQQVSTEPAWLALAKRKAKAWSDCPQIIK